VRHTRPRSHVRMMMTSVRSFQRGAEVDDPLKLHHLFLLLSMVVQKLFRQGFAKTMPNIGATGGGNGSGARGKGGEEEGPLFLAKRGSHPKGCAGP
jgi:hypothetical protein